MPSSYTKAFSFREKVWMRGNADSANRDHPPPTVILLHAPKKSGNSVQDLPPPLQLPYVICRAAHPILPTPPKRNPQQPCMRPHTPTQKNQNPAPTRIHASLPHIVQKITNTSQKRHPPVRNNHQLAHCYHAPKKIRQARNGNSYRWQPLEIPRHYYPSIAPSWWRQK
jgi:hypothetical protein